MTIRLETPADYREVENLTREAFWNVYRPISIHPDYKRKGNGLRLPGQLGYEE